MSTSRTCPCAETATFSAFPEVSWPLSLSLGQSPRAPHCSPGHQPLHEAHTGQRPHGHRAGAPGVGRKARRHVHCHGNTAPQGVCPFQERWAPRGSSWAGTPRGQGPQNPCAARPPPSPTTAALWAPGAPAPTSPTPLPQAPTACPPPNTCPQPHPPRSQVPLKCLPSWARRASLPPPPQLTISVGPQGPPSTPTSSFTYYRQPPACHLPPDILGSTHAPLLPRAAPLIHAALPTGQHLQPAPDFSLRHHPTEPVLSLGGTPWPEHARSATRSERAARGHSSCPPAFQPSARSIQATQSSLPALGTPAA